MSFDGIPENVAAVVFSHVTDPRDRIRLAAVSKVWRDAEKSDVSLPGGSPRALYKLGKGLYDAGKWKRAIYWWRKAIGDVHAMYWIGRCYNSGTGVKVDRRKAVKWWEKASGCGHADATYRLANYYFYGLYSRVEPNAAKAIELYVKAAEQGSEFARVRTREHLLRGEYGVAANKTEALKCFRVAVERGYGTFALRWVEELEDELAEEAAA